jgi:hypothetical protein
MFPVVNDGLPARIKQTVRFAGLANCGAVRRGSERSDRPSRMEPEPPKAAMRLQSCYAVALSITDLKNIAHIVYLVHFQFPKLFQNILLPFLYYSYLNMSSQYLLGQYNHSNLFFPPVKDISILPETVHSVNNHHQRWWLECGL